jgi:hypothetical protein
VNPNWSANWRRDKGFLRDVIYPLPFEVTLAPKLRRFPHSRDFTVAKEVHELIVANEQFSAYVCVVKLYNDRNMHERYNDRGSDLYKTAQVGLISFNTAAEAVLFQMLFL